VSNGCEVRSGESPVADRALLDEGSGDELMGGCQRRPSRVTIGHRFNRRVDGVEGLSAEHDAGDPGPLPQLPDRRLHTGDSELEVALVV
jgi:hypothetical protein